MEDETLIYLENEQEALQEVSFDESNLDIYVEDGPDGCVILKGIPSMPGVLTYKGSAFNRPEPTVRILLTEEVISQDEAQLPNLIITDGHKGLITKKNAKKLASGHVSETIEKVEVSGKKALKVKLILTDDVLFQKIKNKQVRGLSLGYRRTVDWTPIDHPEFGKIDGTYTSRQLNHLAGVANSRSEGANFTEDSAEVLDMTPEEFVNIFKTALDTFKVELLEALKPPAKEEVIATDENDLISYFAKREKLLQTAATLKIEINEKDKNAVLAAKLLKHWEMSLDGSEDTLVTTALAYINIYAKVSGQTTVVDPPGRKDPPKRPLHKGL